MDITKMTAAERADLKAQLEAQEAAEKQKRLDDIETYKGLVSEFVHDTFKSMKALSDQMRARKDAAFAGVSRLIEMKEQLYNTKLDRHTNTFSSDGLSVTLGRRTNDGWDDTVEAGIAKVKDYLATLAKDENSAKLYEMLMKLLSKDRKGNLKASAMLQLEQYASKLNDPMFSEGVQIIRDSYKPVETCDFISVSYKDAAGKEHVLPLSLSAFAKEEE